MKRSRKIALFILLFLTVGVAVSGAVLWSMANQFLKTPANEHFKEEAGYFYLTVESGNTFEQVAQKLYDAHGVSDPFKFKLLALWKGSASSIKAGEFEFHTRWTPEEVLEQLVSGRALLHRVTIPEGLPWWEAGRILAENGFVNFEDFEACIKDQSLLRRYGIPFATAEGFLFPDTYFLHKGRVPTKAHAESAVLTMVQTFWSRSAALWEEAAVLANMEPESDGVEVTASGRVIASFVPRFARKNPEEVKRLVILASLVEKESAVPDERPTVAGVYVNRMRINMPLQCDPTIIYGLGQGFKGKILRSHILDGANTYNTYRFVGLPPGPICSAGLEALNAAFNPASHKFLYFVATGKADGRHTFSTNLSDHNKAVEQYRKALRAQQN